MNIIELKVFPLSLNGYTMIWFTELPYNFINTWDQLRDVFLARYYLVSKKMNHKDRVKNFVALPRESLSSSLERYTKYVRGVTNNHIDHESLNNYFYRGQEDNNKAVIDTISRGQYSECTYAEITEKLDKITRNNKAWSTNNSDRDKHFCCGSYTQIGYR